jgi:hypothetical protein
MDLSNIGNSCFCAAALRAFLSLRCAESEVARSGHPAASAVREAASPGRSRAGFAEFCRWARGRLGMAPGSLEKGDAGEVLMALAEAVAGGAFEVRFAAQGAAGPGGRPGTRTGWRSDVRAFVATVRDGTGAAELAELAGGALRRAAEEIRAEALGLLPEAERRGRGASVSLALPRALAVTLASPCRASFPPGGRLTIPGTGAEYAVRAAVLYDGSALGGGHYRAAELAPGGAAVVLHDDGDSRRVQAGAGFELDGVTCVLLEAEAPAPGGAPRPR